MAHKNLVDPNYEVSMFGLPESCGVYAICISRYNKKKADRKVVYVGSSVNMRKRVMSQNHIYRKLYNELTPEYLVFTACFETKDHIAEEIRMIKKYRPKYNTIHNNG